MGSPHRIEAWGIELGDNLIRAARVSRAFSAFTVEEVKELPLDRADSTQAAWQMAIASAAPVLATLPLAIAIPDEPILHRTLMLPTADAATLGRLVANQAEVILPAQKDTFAWAWGHCGDPLHSGMERVIFCAARKDLVTDLERVAPVGSPLVLTPASIALGQGLSAMGGLDVSSLLLYVGDKSGTLVIVHEGSILRCEVIERGNGQSRWAWQVREACEECLSEMPRHYRPGRCLLTGSACREPELAETLQRTLKMPVETAPVPPRLTLPPGQDFVSLAPAVAAAAVALTAPPATVNLASTLRKVRKPALRITRPMVVAAAWFLSAVLGLYLVDCYHVRRVEGSLEQIATRVGDDRAIERDRAVAQYLAAGGPAPLAILDELSTLAPPQTILTNWRYSRGGEVSVSGTLPNTQELQQFLENLSRSTLAHQVKPGTMKMEKERLKFELSFQAFGVASSRPAPSTAAVPASGSPAGPASPMTMAPAASGADHPVISDGSSPPKRKKNRKDEAAVTESPDAQGAMSGEGGKSPADLRVFSGGGETVVQGNAPGGVGSSGSPSSAPSSGPEDGGQP